MKALLVDSACWIASVNDADIHHAKMASARNDWMKQGGMLVTTDYIVDETLTHMRARFGLPVAEAWWEEIEQSERVRLEWITPDRAAKARDLFFRHHDKDYSFTDCTSFVVMKELKLRQALTTDKHFTQGGFQILPVA